MSSGLKGLSGFLFHEFCSIFLPSYKPFTSVGSHVEEFHYLIKHLINKMLPHLGMVLWPHPEMQEELWGLSERTQ